MNKQITKLANVFARLSAQPAKKKKKRKKDRRVPFSINSKPIKYGPGSNFRVINQEWLFSQKSHTRVPVFEVLLNSGEFYNINHVFRYFKLAWVKVIFFENNAVDDPGRVYVYMSWFSNSNTDADIKKDDQTKMLSAYNTKIRTFTWFPIDINIKFENLAQDPPLNYINPASFNSTDKAYLQNGFPGWIYCLNESDHDLKAEIQLGVVFVGSDYGGNGVQKEKIPPEELFKVKVVKLSHEEEEDGEEEEMKFKKNNSKHKAKEMRK